MDCSTPDFPVHHQLLDPTQTHVHHISDAIQPSHQQNTVEETWNFQAQVIKRNRLCLYLPLFLKTLALGIQPLCYTEAQATCRGHLWALCLYSQWCPQSIPRINHWMWEWTAFRWFSHPAPNTMVKREANPIVPYLNSWSTQRDTNDYCLGEICYAAEVAETHT